MATTGNDRGEKRNGGISERNRYPPVNPGPSRMARVGRRAVLGLGRGDSRRDRGRGGRERRQARAPGLLQALGAGSQGCQGAREAWAGLGAYLAGCSRWCWCRWEAGRSGV